MQQAQADILSGTSLNQKQVRARKKKIVVLFIAGMILSLLFSPAAIAKETKTQKKKSTTTPKSSISKKSKKNTFNTSIAKKSNSKTKSKAKTKSNKSRKNTVSPQDNEELPQLDDEDLGEELAKYIGIPYRLGGNSLKGMDCSAFTKRIYSEKFDEEIPRRAAQQFASSKLEKVSSEELQPGDLVFFSTIKKGISHVGIYLTDNKFIHAIRRKGITVSSLDSNYWKNRIVGAKRLKNIDEISDTSEEMSARKIDLLLNNSIGLRFQLAGRAKKQPSQTQDPFREFFDYQNIMGWDPQTNQPRSLDLEYYHFLEDYLVNVRLIASRHRYYLSAPQEKYVPHLIWPESILARDTGLAGYRQSLKVASDIALFSWLSITPSITYFDYDTTFEDSQTYQRILGIETRLAPQDTRASLSVSFQYADQQGLIAQSLKTTPGSAWEALDVSFNLGYQFSDSLRMSVMGQRAFKDSTLSEKDIIADTLLYNDLYFKFDVSF